MRSSPLFGHDLNDYDLLFNIRDNTHVQWSGERRPSLTGQGIFPRPYKPNLSIWLGVGGTLQYFARAGHPEDQLRVGLHFFGYFSNSTTNSAPSAPTS